MSLKKGIQSFFAAMLCHCVHVVKTFRVLDFFLLSSDVMIGFIDMKKKSEESCCCYTYFPFTLLIPPYFNTSSSQIYFDHWSWKAVSDTHSFLNKEGERERWELMRRISSLFIFSWQTNQLLLVTWKSRHGESSEKERKRKKERGTLGWELMARTQVTHELVTRHETGLKWNAISFLLVFHGKKWLYFFLAYIPWKEMVINGHWGRERERKVMIKERWGEKRRISFRNDSSIPFPSLDPVIWPTLPPSLSLPYLHLYQLSNCYFMNVFTFHKMIYISRTISSILVISSEMVI